MTAVIALFTRNLRVRDNPVLSAAHRQGTTVLPVFVLDQDMLAGDGAILAKVTPNKAAFLCAALTELDDELRRLGSRLIVRRGDFTAEVERMVEESSASAVHLAADVSAYSHRREERLRSALARRGRRLEVHDTTVTVVEPGAITPAGRDHFAVFTPYYRRWLSQPIRNVLPTIRALPAPEPSGGPLPTPDELSPGTASPQLAVGGERTGRKSLDRWLRSPVDHYHDRHDDPAADATSRLSPYLHFGCLSPVEVVHRTRRPGPGREAFVRQLAWRDFHHQVLAARPDTARADYRSQHDRWSRDPELLTAWQRGRTGYPIVDAAMRQLAAQGWLHNRARLIAASFLTKTLYLDWRLGAAHFMDLLVDGDVANNQLNWQWVAGTGTDTRPHRVLNPVRQAQRYDPDGDYVRRWVPELADIGGAAVHTPWELPLDADPPDYPQRIIDHLDGARRFRAARVGG
ncbi:cryptochrome/photolyase family protein [Mycolicibacterium thermoresistibile]